MPVRAFAEFNEDEKLEFLKFYASIPAPNERFNKYGLRFSMDVLKGLGTSIIYFPLETMTEFADAVCINAVKNNPVGIGQQVSAINLNELATMPVNCTSMGNMAYITCHHPSTVIRLKAMHILNAYYQLQLNKK
jgi:hypothetical protein